MSERAMASHAELLRLLRRTVPEQDSRLRRNAETACRIATNAQQRMWFLRRLEGDIATYSVPHAFWVAGALDIEALDHALTAVTARHEAIRTRLVERDGKLWQEVMPACPIRSKRLESDSRAGAVELASAEAAIPFDLSSPPLLRAVSIRVAPESWLLLFVFHHAAFDAWSLGIFFAELSRIYRHPEAKRDLPLPRFQFGDYGDWQREWLVGAAADEQRRYWAAQLAGPLPVLRLASSRPTPAARTYRGRVLSFQIGQDLRSRLNATAERHATTPFVVLMSIFFATLHRFSLQEDIIIGVPAAARSSPDTEGIIGYLSNTIAVRAALQGDMRFSDLLVRTSRTFLDGLSHQDIPFDQIVEAAQLTRQSLHNPVFQAMLVMQNTPADAALRLDGASLEETLVHTGTAKVDVTCSLAAFEQALHCDIEYSSDVFSDEDALGFTRALEGALFDATSRPDIRINELRLFSPEQSCDISDSGTFERYPGLPPLHVLVERWVQRVPDMVAVDASGEQVSYRELDCRANRLAWRLIDAGIGPESPAVLYMRRSVDLVVAVLAVLKAGGAFVPADTRFPIERVRDIVRHARPATILTEAQYLPLLSQLSCPLTDVAAPLTTPETNPDLSVSAAHLACVYYTSGSTGQPKGVMIEHRCAMARLEWLRRRYALGPDQRVLYKTPLIFDVSLWEIFLPLISGATILMADSGSEADVAHIAELLGRKTTVLAHFVPSMLDAYLAHAPRREYPGLKWIAVSGEAVTPELLQRFSRHFAVELHNQYGQTETSEVAVWEGVSDEAVHAVPLGRQVGVYRLSILDANLDPVPTGVPGELCVAGTDGLARGYHSQPELTAEKFVPDPRGVLPGERLYRTGDLVRRLRSGQIEFLGRLDDQTKIRGCRVETTEVEAVLRRHPRVKWCGVVARPDASGANTLIAYVVADDVSASELAAEAARFLPAFMMPAAYVSIAYPPMTASGKIDRMKLPDPQPEHFILTAPGRPPVKPLEQQLATLWSQLLGVNSVGRTDSFFDIGGNSIRAIQVITKIRQTFGVDISVREFFSQPTVEGLAKVVERSLEKLVESLTDAEVARRLQGERDCATASRN